MELSHQDAEDSKGLSEAARKRLAYAFERHPSATLWLEAILPILEGDEASRRQENAVYLAGLKLASGQQWSPESELPSEEEITRYLEERNNRGWER